MEPNDTQHHHHPHHHLSSSSYFTTSTTPAPATTTPSPTNGLLPPPPHDTGGGGGTHMVYPHSVGPSTAAVSSAPVESPRRKRGRPRKYGTPEQALAAKKTASSSSNAVAARERREAAAASSPSYSGFSSRKSQQLVALGNAGQGFTPHVISVSAGEDVAQKIMLFMQQCRREMCILSASGSISNASLRQPATSGGNITYEGRFEIISLSGSYVRTEIGGRAGGLSVCLSNSDGQIIGGGIGGPLIAGGPVQVIIGTFVVDNKKDVGSGGKVDASSSKLPSPGGGASMSNIGFRTPTDTSGRHTFRGNDDHQTMGGNPFMIPPRGMHDWSSGSEARVNATFELTGRRGHGARQSPENGDYEQYPD
ncbi:AT-hook motif nuclear-localized protein 14 [Ricinus communis]|uniref:AT-hook motif nuclear-localized protein n=1 Tax=Ricinus communis TaxID=3988 RepID=B9S7I7_RICCO|nr:AT-hook motif nuclear-localized protein 14 [Ricinus communis]EEF40360.1 DNA binding protein, putative [Ricinus communis]|eukprot:XP_002521956.1 AT-hook motif nuclear-localized protein 14 [Ricinus communis]